MAGEEWLHATNAQGQWVKTGPRSALMEEIRHHARKCGDAPLALPVVHIILMTSTGQVRLVQRGDKPENPYMWDKAVGGHVVTEDPTLPHAAFEENVYKEMGEEIGLTNIEIAPSPFDYIHRLHSGTLDLQEHALIRMIDYDPWQGVFVQVKDGKPWVKRLNVVVYAGVYDGPLTFVDGEAINSRSMDLNLLHAQLQQSPWLYADGVRIFMQRYRPLMMAGLQEHSVG
ncbi:hypothetical protein [Magnetococcus sp. PR-3]|uniref:hypothetical protein n=1 Tax=Magnetococcus sp. PR-3 TaxID=3120355 RepID=UPI002FCE23A8